LYLTEELQGGDEDEDDEDDEDDGAVRVCAG
jgi:hypothetical protein